MYEAVLGAVTDEFGDQVAMVPEYSTPRPSEPTTVKRSRWLSIVIHVLGPMTFESVIPFGIVLIIFSKTVKHVFSKACAEDMALTVALLSDENMRRSDRKVVFCVVTRGPPCCPVPLRYSLTLALSKENGVLSKWSAPSKLLTLVSFSEHRHTQWLTRQLFECRLQSLALEKS